MSKIITALQRSEEPAMLLTRKATAGNVQTQSRLTRPVSSMLGRTVDRRTFLKRSGLTMGAGAVASQLPCSMLSEAQAAEKGSTSETIETKRTVCTHCCVGCS